jgi:hypothetical protein
VGTPSLPTDPEKPKATPLAQTLVEHPEEVAKLLKSVEEVIDHYTSNREKHFRAVANAQARTAARVIAAVLVVVSAAVLATGYLAYRGTVSGDAFTFVVGTVVGSLIAFMAEHIAPNLSVVEEVED